MAHTTASEVYDLLIVVDATPSMFSYLRALNQSLPQIISLSALTDCFERIGVLAYRDYDQSPEYLLEWSGWTSRTDTDEERQEVIRKTSSIDARYRPFNGSADWPEAAKTGLARAYELMREDAVTLVLFYADAPPHLKGVQTSRTNNCLEEQLALVTRQAYGHEGAAFADWANAARVLAESPKRAHVISILDPGTRGDRDDRWYYFLSEKTGGTTIVLQNQQSRTISEVTIEILLSWMGVRKEGTGSGEMAAELVRFKRLSDAPGVPELSIVYEEEALTAGALWANYRRDPRGLSRATLDEFLPKKKTALPNFTEKYRSSEMYRSQVNTQLRDIISRDVSAMSLNPVFGSLWRVFCNDRENDQRQGLLDLFGRKVEEIQDAGERTRMKEWLEESYDYTAEVLEKVSKVPISQRFPCVCLDPTLVFTASNEADEDNDEEEDDGDDEQDQPITSFRRDELLEIGRSCDRRILRRLGRVLTRLTFIESAESVPAHIAATKEENVPRVPLALASEEHKRQFWRILLHIVVPGTMLSARPAAVLAALAICLGITPLIDVAEQEMLFWRGRWNNLEVPETWNSSCLSLLLDADHQYRQRVRKNSSRALDQGDGLLQDEDRAIFKRLQEYKLLEHNLNTTLTARVGWQPQGVTSPIGPVVLCKACKVPRSVTIMGPDNVCGLCLVPWEDSQAQEKALHTRVQEPVGPASDAVWYECNVMSCRAQYVVYNVEQLNVRPKCHYCRIEGLVADTKTVSSAPRVECTKCLSRMIWPVEYRGDEDFTNWQCIACRAGKETIVSLEVTANQLRTENGSTWLLRNTDHKIPEPFTNRSLFHTATTSTPLSDFCTRVAILPGLSNPTLTLTLLRKPLHNTPALLSQLSDWLSRRRVQLGQCSLCARDRRHHELSPACGRRGCEQKICQRCLKGWYGLNAPGKILNFAALNCPFCRRAPTTKTLAAHGTGVHAVADLKDAVARAGEWVFAWCGECGHAKEFVERVCAGGAPAEVHGWVCDACREERETGTGRRIKECPGCGTMTEKTGGCDHITCKCGTHWCFFCGEKQEREGIYDHMNTVHGGIYQGANDYDEVDEMDEDEY